METTSKKDAAGGACPDPLAPAPHGVGSSQAAAPSNTESTAVTVTYGAAAGVALSAGRYRLDRCLGRGSFGEVWQAFDPVLNLAVAIKMPRADRTYSTEQSDQFVEEARKQARLNHPAIVKVRHAEREASSWLIVTDYIDGASLDQRMAARKFTAQESARLVADIADALHFAHKQRLIHRDVKPANILMDAAGRPFLTDFGLALGEDEQQDQRNVVAGTFAYMSPEQIRGDSHLLDGRADIYSLGVVLYELLTGVRPFRGNALEEFREQILFRAPKPPRAIVESIPRELERICLKCLAKAPTERYLTAADLAADLRRSVKSKSRWLWTAAAAASLAALGIILALVRPWSLPQDPDRVEKPAPSDGVVARPAPRDGWTPLWNPPPTKLVWQARPGNSLLEVKDAEESIWAVCDGHGVFKLGVVNEPNYTFRVNIKVIDGRGTFGLLLGYRYVVEDGSEQAHFEMIRLQANYPGAKEKFLLSDYAVEYSEARGGFPMGRALAHAKLADLPPRECPLEIVVADDRLASVRCDGRLLPELAPQAPPANFRPRTFRGAIGCYVHAGTFQLHRPELKVKKDKP
jgi:serine/threonine protein kinase